MSSLSMNNLQHFKHVSLTLWCSFFCCFRWQITASAYSQFAWRAGIEKTLTQLVFGKLSRSVYISSIRCLHLQCTNYLRHFWWQMLFSLPFAYLSVCLPYIGHPHILAAFFHPPKRGERGEENNKKHLKKCWAHSPLRAAARSFTRCR